MQSQQFYMKKVLHIIKKGAEFNPGGFGPRTTEPDGASREERLSRHYRSHWRLPDARIRRHRSIGENCYPGGRLTD